MANRDLLNRIPTSSFVGGVFTGGTPSLPVINPNTGETLTSIVSADAEATSLAALDAAHAAQEAWAATTSRHRSEILHRVFTLIHERAEDFATLMTLEMGKPYAESLGEVAYGAEFMRWFSEEAVRGGGRFRSAPALEGHTIITAMKPVGSCLLITPWNFPLSMATRKIAPALAAGCTVILKPAGQTPLTALFLMDVLRESGVPNGVVNCVVTKDSRIVSETLLADKRLRKISFTGSTEVGRGLLSLASKHVVRSSMELGGNAPFLVLESADLEKAAAQLMPAKFRNNGQACTAANRIYVLEKHAKEFEKLVEEKVRALRLGDGMSEGVTLSALINEAAVDNCRELVKDALDRGARLVCGGSDELTSTNLPGGFFFPATVLADVPADARVCKEEIFGPIAPIITCTSVDEMVALANDTEYGLMAYAFAEDMAEVRRVVPKIESGMIAVNVGVASDPAAPFGGVKESGIGREGSHEGLTEYQEVTYVRLGP